MKGDQRLSHNIFRNGALHVPRNKQTLQKLLSLYHPQRNTLFEEWKPEIEAADDLEILDYFFRKGSTISLPKIRKKSQMEFHKWFKNDPLLINKYEKKCTNFDTHKQGQTDRRRWCRLGGGGGCRRLRSGGGWWSGCG